MAVGDLVKSTLGPKGMVCTPLAVSGMPTECSDSFFQDKILQCNMSGGPDAGKLLVTNDGATILSKIGVDNPVAKVLVGRWIRVCVTRDRNFLPLH